MWHPECNPLVLATGNPNKALELRELLAPLPINLQTLADFPNATAPPEDGQSLQDNARRKAIGYARQLRAWVLADDTGLEVDALNGRPGIRSARFAGEQATMTENRAKLLSELRSVPDHDRTARFVCQLAVADPTGNVVAEASGECRGRIVQDARGNQGFGYDSLFELAEYHLMLAELGPASTTLIGHRGRAARALITRLSQLYHSGT